MADRYWVGGTGTWNTTSTTNWSATSGGAGGASVPTTSDPVIFNAASGTGTVTLTGALNCRTLDMTGSGLFTFTSTGTLTCGIIGGIGGSFLIVANTTWSATGTLTIAGAISTTITTNGRTLSCGVIINTGGGTPTLAGALTSNGTVTLTSGFLNLNNFNLTCSAFSSSNSTARGVDFGTGSITILGSGTVWNTATSTNMTNSGTPTVNISNATATATTITAGTTGGSSTNAVNFNITTGTYALTVTTASIVRNLNFTGFTGTWTQGTANCNFFGDLTLVTGMTFTGGTGALTFVATSGVQVLTSAGKTLGNVTQSGIAGTVRLAAGTTTLATTRTYTLTAGTLDLGTNTATLSCGTFSSNNSNTRIIQFGTGNITITGSGVPWAVQTASGLTYTGSRTVNISNPTTSSVTIFQASTAGGSSTTALDFNITTGTYTLTFGTGTFGPFIRNLNFTGFTGTFAAGGHTIYGNITLATGMTYASGVALTLTGGVAQTLISAGKTVNSITLDTTGTTLTLGDTFSQATTSTTTVATSTAININGQTNTFGIVSASFASTFWTGGTLNATSITQTGGTATSPIANLTFNGYTLSAGTLDISSSNFTCTTFNLGNTNTRAIVFGSNKITTTGTGTVLSATAGTNFSYTGSGLFEINNNTATNATINIQATGFTSANAVNVNVISGTYALNTTGTYNSLNFTGFAGTLNAATRTIYGNLTFSAGMATVSGVNDTTFAATSGTQVITSNAIDIAFGLNINAPAATVQLADNLLGQNANSGLIFTQGTFDANNNNVTILNAVSSGTGTKVITMGSGLWTLSGTGNVWDMSPANTTLNSNTANIVLSDTSTSARTFGGGDKTYNKLTIGGSTGISTTAITGSNTFSEIDSTKTVAHTIDFASGATNAIATWSVTGTAGNIVGVESVTAGSISTLSIANTITLDYMRVLDVVKSGTGVVTLDDSQVLGQSDGWVIGPGTVYTPYIILFSGSGTVTLPSSWNPLDNSVYMIGGGAAGINGASASGGGGGGGGAFTKLTNYPGTPLSNIAYSVGSGGSTSAGNGGNTTFGVYVANGGRGTVTRPLGGVGGAAQSISGIITAAYSGGSGGSGITSGVTPFESGGGGGAAGPLGNGGNGANATSTIVGGGGGNGGGSAGSGSTGGNNFYGVGGGAAGLPGTNGGGGGGRPSANTLGGNGSTGTDILGITGSGGGSGGNGTTAGSPTAGIGGGGGGAVFNVSTANFAPGTGGVIVLAWSPAAPIGTSTGNFFLMF